MSVVFSRPFLILGDIIAITVAIAAFAQAVSWTIAGILILVSLVLPLLANIVPPKAQLAHVASRIPSASHHFNTDTKPQHKSAEKPSLSSHQSVAKTESKQHPKQQAVSVPQPRQGQTVPSIGIPHPSPQGPSPPTRVPPIKQGPNLNPTIAKDDYMEYDVELEAGKDFVGEVTADGLVNVYLLDEENMDNLDEGEEFWSETGEEGVETAKLEFTALSQGKWFFVVENADDREIAATVKMQKGTTSRTPA